MRYQEQVVKGTQLAVEGVCRAALAVPPERRDWAPGGAARSTLSQMQELAMQADFFLPIFLERQVPEFDEHAKTQSANLRDSFDTVEKCVEALRESTSSLCRAIANFPDESLEWELTMPWGGGMTMTMADVLGLPAWNATYHLGQINQIQMLLGDAEMH